MKKILIVLGIIILAGVFVYYTLPSEVEEIDSDVDMNDEVVEESTVPEITWEREVVLGSSVEGKNIIAYQYGTGTKELLFVGGIHGGYSWNTSAVAYDLIDYVEANNEIVPEGIQLTVVPALNPDGLSSVVEDYSNGFSPSDVSGSESDKVAARFNANEVDLNRNFDCDWQTDAKWQDKDVSGGDVVFSEPESKAIRDYIMNNEPEAVVVWYAAGGGVFASNCHGGVLDEVTEITSVYADASGYKAYDSFDFYATTGDMVNWLAKEGVPAISVLLTNHEDVEFTKNLRGIEALIEYYTE